MKINFIKSSVSLLSKIENWLSAKVNVIEFLYKMKVFFFFLSPRKFRVWFTFKCIVTNISWVTCLFPFWLVSVREWNTENYRVAFHYPSIGKMYKIIRGLITSPTNSFPHYFVVWKDYSFHTIISKPKLVLNIEWKYSKLTYLSK